MFGPAERWVARRYLKPNREHGFVSIVTAFALIGIALGVGTLIVVLAVMNGFRAELLGRVLGINGHLTAVSGPIGFDEFDEIAARFGAIDEVVTVTPYVEGQAMASANGRASGVLVRGLRETDLQKLSVLADNVVAGSLQGFDDADRVAIGVRMAQRLGLRIGDKLTLISPEGTSTAFGTIPRVLSYEVGAVFEIGMYEYDNAVIYMPLHLAQLYFDLDGRVNGIDLFVRQPDSLGLVPERAAAALGPVGWITTWQESNSAFFNALQVERNVMFLILTLIILVAAFNIVTGLTMLVRSKGRDIAILRTMGATRGVIMRIFFMAGMSIGVLGTAIGFGLGLAFALNIDQIRVWLEGLTGAELWAAEIRFLSQLPAKVEVDDVLSVVGMALILTFVATLFPAWRAARLDPVEALRRE